MVPEVEEWGTLIEDIAQHLKASCVVDVDTTWPTHRWKFLAKKILFETNCIEPLANDHRRQLKPTLTDSKGTATSTDRGLS